MILDGFYDLLEAGEVYLPSPFLCFAALLGKSLTKHQGVIQVKQQQVFACKTKGYSGPR